MRAPSAPGSIDPRIVTPLLRRHIHPDAECTAVSRAATGNSQETWYLTVGGVSEATSLVLRRSAGGGTLEWSDRGVEVAILGAVAAAGLPVPRVRWWEPDGSELIRAYVVMDRAPGEPPDLRRADVRSTLAADLGRWIARLHADVRPPDELSPPASTAQASHDQVAMWTNRARASGVAPAITAALCGWLAAHVPDDGIAPVLLWGDPGPHNVLTDPQGRITALLDWELAHVGHPLLDVGAARWSCLGHLDRDVLTTAYEHERGVPTDRRLLGWFEVLACVSRSVMLFDGVRAAIDGRAHDPNVVALGTAMVSANMLRAASIAWGLDPHDVAGDEPFPVVLRPTSAERDGALAQFLRDDVLPAVSDARVRRGLRVAGALLSSSSSAEQPTSEGDDAWDWYAPEAERSVDALDRRRLVAGIVAERARHTALLKLYGATTSITPGEPSASSGP